MPNEVMFHSASDPNLCLHLAPEVVYRTQGSHSAGVYRVGCGPGGGPQHIPLGSLQLMPVRQPDPYIKGSCRPEL